MRYALEWQPSNADVFLTKPGPFTELASAAVAEVTGRKPKLSTTGGTSDARFIKDYCPVLEFGLVGQTAHQVDECAPLGEFVALTAIYRRIIEALFGLNAAARRRRGVRRDVSILDPQIKPCGGAAGPGAAVAGGPRAESSRPLRRRHAQ